VHFKVFKSTIGDDTQSELKVLTTEERVVEIAQMLSGTVISDSALHAKSLAELEFWIIFVTTTKRY
jgi:DNA repair protein RecN (Recombination protein N)